MRTVRAAQVDCQRKRPAALPLEEGIQPVLDDKRLARAWMRLAANGNTDWRIANLVAADHEMSVRTVEGRISRLRKAGKIGENPNKRRRNVTGTDFLVSARAAFMANGLCDGAIAGVLSEATGRPVDSLKTSISQLVGKGMLEPNPNNQKELGADEFRWIARRRRELRTLKLKDTSIARIMAVESEDRNASALRRIFWENIQDGIFEKNENPGNRVMERVILRRYELMKEGLDDQAIAARIAKEMEMKTTPVGLLIHTAVNIGGCLEN
jgi:hypothetical protein